MQFVFLLVLAPLWDFEVFFFFWSENQSISPFSLIKVLHHDYRVSSIWLNVNV